MNLSFELVAVFVAAVSGALAGRQKDMDLFGMYVVGVLTGMGGKTTMASIEHGPGGRGRATRRTFKLQRDERWQLQAVTAD